MGIFIRRRGETVDPYWWGFWQSDGKRHEVSLCKWDGTPPRKGEKTGNAPFEQSRERALRLFKEKQRGGENRDEELALAKKVYSLRYGGKIERVKIAELRARWDALPHKAGLTEARRERVHSVLRRFEDFMRERFPGVTEAGALSAEHFKAFFADVERWGIAPRKKEDAPGKDAPGEEGGGVTARTWNDVLDILRGVLRKVDGQSAGFRDYLANLPKRAESTVHRRPFTGDELDAIFTAAGEVDPEIRPVLVAAACTALRRGDVATLEWDDVDLSAGFVTVKTSKTGETVEIPIFPPFMAVLQEAARKRRAGVPYVFPKIALAYQRNADGLNVRLRKVLAAAGFETPCGKDVRKHPAPASPSDAVAKIDAGMRGAGWTEARRQKGLAILQRHFEGKNGRTIAAEMGIARGAVSTYLHEMEDAGGVALVTPPQSDTPRKATLAERRNGEPRKRRGSLCGWHSFRTTFCTLALSNGVPMDLLRKITGHRTAEIVLKHYDRRGREEMRKVFGDAMPKAIAGAVAGAVHPGGASGETGEELEFIAIPSNVAALFSKATTEEWAFLAECLEKRRG